MVEFLEKHTEFAVPSEKKLRDSCVPLIFDEYIGKMRAIAAGNYIWISIDETTDCEQRYVINFVFGVLGLERERGKSYLFSSAVLEAANHSTIATFFDDTVNDLSEWKQ